MSHLKCGTYLTLKIIMVYLKFRFSWEVCALPSNPTLLLPNNVLLMIPTSSL